MKTEKKKLVILQGIPASGKSTWAREFIKDKKDWFIVNKDSLRTMRGDYWIPRQEGLIAQIEHFCVEEAMKIKLNIIIDGTNMNESILTIWKALADQYECEIEIKKFQIDLKTAIERDSKRENPIGKDIITHFYDKYVSN